MQWRYICLSLFVAALCNWLALYLFTLVSSVLTGTDVTYMQRISLHLRSFFISFSFPWQPVRTRSLALIGARCSAGSHRQVSNNYESTTVRLGRESVGGKRAREGGEECLWHPASWVPQALSGPTGSRGSICSGLEEMEKAAIFCCIISHSVEVTNYSLLHAPVAHQLALNWRWWHSDNGAKHLISLLSTWTCRYCALLF